MSDLGMGDVCQEYKSAQLKDMLRWRKELEKKEGYDDLDMEDVCYLWVQKGRAREFKKYWTKTHKSTND